MGCLFSKDGQETTNLVNDTIQNESIPYVDVYETNNYLVIVDNINNYNSKSNHI